MLMISRAAAIAASRFRAVAFCSDSIDSFMMNSLRPVVIPRSMTLGCE
jgi:hypothetical protein